MESKINVGIIISTYNNPSWLEKTLWGYLYQTRPADEIIIADDGSKEDTRLLTVSKINFQLNIYGTKITDSKNHEY